MKKLLVFIAAISLLTACGEKSETSVKTENAKVQMTEETNKESESAFCMSIDDSMIFKNIDDFIEFSNSEEFLENCSEISQNTIQTYSIKTPDFSPIIPTYDKNKYELWQIEYHKTGYVYYFKNRETEKGFSLSIKMATAYHTFEEMRESANKNLVAEVENIETTVWGDTPALIQSVIFSSPTEYSIRAMIDENNSVFLSEPDMTPEELTACLNDFTFE